MSSNMQQAMAKASQFAKSPSQVQARDQAVATANAATPATPAPTLDVAAQLAQMQAMMQQLMDTNAQQAAQIAEFKSGKAAPKAEKAPRPPVTAKNVTWSHDAKKGTVTLVLDLNAQVLDDESGERKVSGSGLTWGVGSANGKLPNSKGVEIGFSLNVFEKIPGATKKAAK